MKRIGIISDTHGYWDDKYETYLGDVDEIWHAGDIGTTELADKVRGYEARLQGRMRKLRRR